MNHERQYHPSIETIRKRRTFLTLLSHTVAEETVKLQTQCPHPALTKQYQSSTGHYDKSNDHYWIHWNCPDCGKHWRTGQGIRYELGYAHAVTVK